VLRGCVVVLRLFRLVVVHCCPVVWCGGGVLLFAMAAWFVGFIVHFCCSYFFSMLVVWLGVVWLLMSYFHWGGLCVCFAICYWCVVLLVQCAFVICCCGVGVVIV